MKTARQREIIASFKRAWCCKMKMENGKATAQGGAVDQQSASPLRYSI